MKNNSKNNCAVNIPLTLNISKYFSNNNIDIYNLYAVIQHYGNLSGGHYVAICENIDQKWYLFDDSKVTEIDPCNIDQKAAYILFYRKNTVI